MPAKKKATKKAVPRARTAETVVLDALARPFEIARLVPHPRNYRTHPEDQLRHLAESLREHGPYRNVVAARGHVILAGHGLVQAAALVPLTHLPVLFLDLDANDPRALKILTGDNEIAHLAEVDDRVLTEMLRELNATNNLLGTGYDARMLSALTMVTRPASEIANIDEAAQWVGMPEYEPTAAPIKVIVQFRSLEDRTAFAERLGLSFTEKTTSAWWPERARDDIASVRFEDA